MMNRILKSLAAVIWSILLITLPMQSEAGILGNINSLFMSNSTASTTFTTKDRTGVFGGSFEMRSPVTNVTLVSFDPPRADAGCGGIDLYGGSFSFINGQQLIKILRSVASDAAGLAFEAAIKIISPNLDALIQHFQALMQELNNLGKNSCQLAHAIVDPVEKAANNAINGEGSTGAQQSGIFSDGISTLDSWVSSATTTLSHLQGYLPQSGNQLAKAMTASLAADQLGLPGVLNPDGSSTDASNPNDLNNELLYAVLGYDVQGISCNNANEDGTSTTTVSSGLDEDVPRIECKGTPTVMLEDLMRGGGTNSTDPNKPLYLYKCLNTSGDSSNGFDPQICTRMQKFKFPYQGIRGYVNTVLFGTADTSSGLDGVTSSSMLGQYMQHTSIPTNPSLMAFQHQSGLPIYALLAKTSSDSTRYNIAKKLAPQISNCIGAQIGYAIYKASMAVEYDNQYQLADWQKQARADWRHDMLKLHDQCVSSVELANIVKELNEETVLYQSNSAK